MEPMIGASVLVYVGSFLLILSKAERRMRLIGGFSDHEKNQKRLDMAMRLLAFASLAAACGFFVQNLGWQRGAPVFATASLTSIIMLLALFAYAPKYFPTSFIAMLIIGAVALLASS
ncbi:MAG: hypothetical protein AAFY83_06630 [Pseudomonadota bacterium]